jgi:hypothetical protein
MSLPQTHPALFTSTHDDWATPGGIIDLITNEYGAITLDAAAEKRTATAHSYFGPDHADPTRRDALAHGLTWADPKWHAPGMPHHTYLNPPYGRRMNVWADRALACAIEGVPITLLLPARTDTHAFQLLVRHAHAIHLIPGRLRFTRAEGETGRAPFPSAIIHLTPASAQASTTGNWLTVVSR